jgi:hypothetical protein
VSGNVSDDGSVRVEWVYTDEGWWGDYDSSNPEDEALLRFDIHLRTPDGWIEMEDGSYCTRVPYDTPEDDLVKLAQVMANTMADTPGRRTAEVLSWVSPDWLTRVQDGRLP